MRSSSLRNPKSEIRNGPVARAVVVVCAAVLLLAGSPAFAGDPGAPGDLYVSSGSSVLQYDGATGDFVGTFASGGGLSGAKGLVFSIEGNLFVAGEGSDAVIEYDGTDGALIGTFASGGGLNGPWGLGFGPNGNAFVSSLWTDSVIEFNGTSGALIGTFASGGGLGYPTGLTFWPNGNLFVSSYSSASVIEYDGLDGTLVGTFASGGGLSDPRGLVFGPSGDLFVVSNDTNSVIEYDGASGALVGTFASGGGLDAPEGLAFGPGGNLFVASSASGEVIEYDGTTGALVGTFASGAGSAAYLVFKPYPGPFPEPDVTGFVPAQAGNCGVLVGATITGTGLVSGAQVALTRAGEADIPGLVTGVVPDTEITADFDLTGAALGFWDLVLTYPDEQTDTLLDALDITPCPPPMVTDFQPMTAGDCGVLVGATITGSDFLPGLTVTLTMAGEPDMVGTNVDVQSSTTIVADFDLTSVALGFWDVTVTNPGGTGSATLVDALEVLPCPPPTVTDFQPGSAGNCGVLLAATITGTGFLPGATVTLTMAGELDIDGTNVDVQSSTTIVADFDLTGVALGYWELVVTNPGPSGSGSLIDALDVTACPPPTVSDFVPAQADNCGPLVGATISGSDFLPGATVTLTMAGEADIGGTNVDVQSSIAIVADFDLTAAVIGFWDVTVTNPGGTGSATLVDALEVMVCPPPQVTDFTPASAGNCGPLLAATITGSDFVPGATVTLVRAGEPDIDGTNVDVQSSTTIVADFDLTAAATGFWDVMVTNPGGSGSGTLVDALEVLPCPPPEVTDFSPAEADNCGTLTGAIITGAYFTTGTTVTLTRTGEADIVGTSVDVQSSTTIVADFDLAWAATGWWDLLVTRPDGQGAWLGAALEVTSCPLDVTSISPAVATNCAAPYSPYISGSGPFTFFETEARLTRTGEADIIGTTVFVIAEATAFRATFDMSDTDAASVWDLVVSQPDGDSATLEDAVTVGQCGVVGDLYGINTNYVNWLGATVSQVDGTTGELVGQFVTYMMDMDPSGLAWGGPNGNLFLVADNMEGLWERLLEIDGRTGEVRRIVSHGADGAIRGDLTFGPDGHLFAADRSSTAGGRVWQFDPGTGALIAEFVPFLSGGLCGANSLVFGPNGNLFILSQDSCDEGTAGVLEFDGQTGAFVGVFVDPNVTEWVEPYGLAFSPTTGNLLVADALSDQVGLVRQFDGVTGEQLDPFVAPVAPGGGGLGRTGMLTFGPNGNLFVHDDWHDALREYDGVTGECVGNFTSLRGHFTRTRVTFKPDLGPFPQPQLLSLVPLNPEPADNCGWLDAEITGTGLVPGATLSLVKAGEPQIDGALIEFTADTSVTGNFYLGGVATGYWDLLLTYPDGQSDTLTGALDIVACPGPTVDGISVTEVENCAPVYGAVITGSRLVESSTAMLIKPGEPDIVGQVILRDPPQHCCGFAPTEEMVVHFPISGAALGSWDLVVTNPWGQSATLSAAVDITRCSLPYRFYDLLSGPLPAGSTHWAYGNDVNDDGTVVGWFQTGYWTIPTRAFIWSDGVATVLDRPSPDPTRYRGDAFWAVSEEGVAFGESDLGGLAEQQPAMYADGEMIHLPDPNNPCGSGHSNIGFDNGLRAANGTGTLACGSKRFLGCPHWYEDYPVLWLIEDDTAIALPDPPDFPWEGWRAIRRATGVNDSGTVAVYLQDYPDPMRSFLYQHPDGVYIEEIANPFGFVQARAINNLGMVVGLRWAPGYDAFAYFDGAMTSLGPGLADDVNDHGDAVGCYPSSGNYRRARLFSGGESIDLQELYLEPLTSGGWNHIGFFSVALAINNNGWIVGRAVGWSYGGPGPGWREYAWLLVPNLEGDFDSDGHVTLDDFAVFADCMGGPDAPPDPTPPTNPADCLTAFDFDEDGDVDLADFAAFQRTLPRDGQPEPGACCFGDGSCSVEWPSMCFVLGGAYMGDGTTCDGVDCPDAGACCFDDGSCTDWFAQPCEAAGGTYQGDATTCGLIDCPFGRYSNEIDPMTSVALAGAGLQLADDMTLEGAGARDLVYLDLRVYGGDSGGGDFDVTVELWTDCPGNGGTLIPDTTFSWTAVPDDGYVYSLVVDPLSPAVTIPDTLWMTATFTTPESGWIIAEQAETGTTADLFGVNQPPWDCNTWFGGDPYAGLWANLRCVEGGGKSRGADKDTRLSIERMETPVSIEAVE